METSKETPKEPFEPFENQPLPELDLSVFNTTGESDSGEEVNNSNDNNQPEEETPPTSSSGGDSPPPPKEPPAPPEPGEPGEDPEDPFKAWESLFNVKPPVVPLRLESVSTMMLNEASGSWETIPPLEPNGPDVLEIENGDFAVTNRDFLEVYIEDNEYAIVLREETTDTNGVLKFTKEDLHASDGSETGQNYIELINERISAVENFSASSDTRATIFAPLPIPEGETERDIEAVESTQQDVAELQALLTQKFEGRIAIMSQGYEHNLGISATDGSIVANIHGEHGTDLYVIRDGEINLHASELDIPPQQRLEDLEGNNEFLNATENAPWLITPEGENTTKPEGRDYWVGLDHGENPDDTGFVLSFYDGGESLGEARISTNGTTMNIDALPLENTPANDVDLPATLTRRIELLANVHGCQEIRMPSAEAFYNALQLESQITGRTDIPSLEKIQQAIDVTADNFGYTLEGNYWKKAI